MTIALRSLTIVALAAAVSACAPQPENITAAKVDPSPFANLTCAQLVEYDATLTAAYNQAADIENTARTEDAVGMVFGFQFGSMRHPLRPAQIAELKGRLVVVHQLETTNNCPTRQASLGK